VAMFGNIKKGGTKMKKIIILLAIMLIISGVFSSCKKSGEIGQPVVGVYPGNIAANFTETNSQGNEITLESFRGKVILLTFSAMWSNPCRLEAPDLVDLYNTYKEQGLEIVQCIYHDEDGTPTDLSDLARWINEFGITFTVFNDPDLSTVYLYNLDGIPFNVFIDRDFIIRYRFEGYRTAALRECTEALL
jgi:peroxiredoxin